jgi:hypothetical protein
VLLFSCAINQSAPSNDQSRRKVTHSLLCCTVDDVILMRPSDNHNEAISFTLTLSSDTDLDNPSNKIGRGCEWRLLISPKIKLKDRADKISQERALRKYASNFARQTTRVLFYSYSCPPLAAPLSHIDTELTLSESDVEGVY